MSAPPELGYLLWISIFITGALLFALVTGMVWPVGMPVIRRSQNPDVYWLVIVFGIVCAVSAWALYLHEALKEPALAPPANNSQVVPTASAPPA